MSSAESGGRQVWACRFCGNLMLREERPTKCLNCRRGESDLQLNDDRLFEKVQL
jgi:rubrerythrin